MARIIMAKLNYGDVNCGDGRWSAPLYIWLVRCFKCTLNLNIECADSLFSDGLFDTIDLKSVSTDELIDNYGFKKRDAKRFARLIQDS